MVLFINASTVKFGGGLIVSLKIIKSLQKLPVEIIIISPQNIGYENVIDQSKLIFSPKLCLLKPFRFILDYIIIPRIINKINPDFVLSLGNLPTITNKKQAYFFDNPFTTLINFSSLKLNKKQILIHKLRNYIFKKRLKYIDLFFTQTYLQLKKLKEIYNINHEIKILPNTYVEILPEEKFKGFNFNVDKKYYYLLCLSRYYNHKNLEILIDLAKIINAKKLNYKIITTISGTECNSSKIFLKKINKNKLNKIIINLKHIPINEICSLYSKIDAIIFPTLLESFSAMYSEAMFFEKPIITSDRNFSREICGDSAYYFDPFYPQDIIEKINYCFANPTERKRKIIMGKNLLKSMPNWNENAKIILSSINKILNE